MGHAKTPHRLVRDARSRGDARAACPTGDSCPFPKEPRPPNRTTASRPRPPRRRNYLRGGKAFIDVISTIPFDFIATIISADQHNIRSLGNLRILRVLRLSKLLRVLRSNRVLKRLEDQIYFNYRRAVGGAERPGPGPGPGPWLFLRPARPQQPPAHISHPVRPVPSLCCLS